MTTPDSVYGIECPFCSTQFYSAYTHDFKYCPCGYCFVDGGRKYLRYGWGIPGKNELTKQIGKPEMVLIKLKTKEA